MTSMEQLVHHFYTAFQRKDRQTLVATYHPEATFSDPVFPALHGSEVGAMWHMLITAGTDLQLDFKEPVTDGETVICCWRARYTFSKTGRKVDNHVVATLYVCDGKITRHQDVFDFWRWCRMALGLTGILLGWTSLVQEKVRAMARKNLKQFMGKNPA